jgi:hypothetical protein
VHPQAPPRRGFFVYAQTMESLTELPVRYAETDAMGIVHHGAPSAIASAARREREDSAGRCPIRG